jgi:predicted acyltransferase
VIPGLLFTSAVCLLITLILKESSTPMGELMRKVFRWGIFFLIVGYILDPFEGGIKKDPATPSYFYVCSGMAVCTLIFFFILVDGLKKGKWLELLRVGGSQPMMAYFIGGHFLFPLLHITWIIRPIDAFIANNTALGTTWGFLLVLYVFGGVWVFNRMKIYLRV